MKKLIIKFKGMGVCIALILLLALFAAAISGGGQAAVRAEGFPDPSVPIRFTATAAGTNNLTVFRMQSWIYNTAYTISPREDEAEGTVYRLPFHSWETQGSSNILMLATPIDTNHPDYRGISLRIYAHISPSEPWQLTEGPTREWPYGFDFYAADTVNTDFPAANDVTSDRVSIPRDIRQKEWIDWNIPASTALMLADKDGVIRGIKTASKNTTSDSNKMYIGTAYIEVASVSLRPKGVYPAEYLVTGEEMPTSSPHAFPNWKSLTQVNGFHNGSLGPQYGWYINPRPISIVEDLGASNELAYQMFFHSWAISTSSNALSFNRTLTQAELSDGIVIRLKTHLSPNGQSYATDRGGRLGKNSNKSGIK